MRNIEILSEKRLLDDFFKVDEILLRYERFDGRMSRRVRRLNLDRGDGVAALLFRPANQRVVLVRQFRYPACKAGPGWLLEVVAGGLQEDASPEDAVRREILEETGYAVEALESISTFYLTPGGSSERIFLYYGEVSGQTRRAPGGGLEEEGEDIEVVEMPAEEAWKAVESGRIVDAKTLIALMWFRRRAEREGL